MFNEQKQKLHFVRLAPPESCVLDLKPCLENVDDSESIGKRLKTKILPSKLRQTQEGVFRGRVPPPPDHAPNSYSEAALNHSGLKGQAVPMGTRRLCKASVLIKDLGIGLSGQLDNSRLWGVLRLALECILYLSPLEVSFLIPFAYG